MQAHVLEDDADKDSVSRSLKAYLLWLFDYMMFNNSHGNSVDKILIDYAREIADSDPEKDVPLYSWGSAVLAATYHGLCENCMKSESNGILTGCPLLLQLWSYERLVVGCPMASLVQYAEFYEHGDEDSRPTMGTL